MNGNRGYRAGHEPALKKACLMFIALVALAQSQVALEVTQDGFKEVTDKIWNPYAAWWIEDAGGKMVKLIYLTYYDDNTQAVNKLAGCEKSGYLSSLTYFTKNRSFGPDVYCPRVSELASGLDCGKKPFTPWSVDGITGCSAPNSGAGQQDKMTRVWDLTDRDGNPVAPGTYYFFYNSVIRDESKDPSDRAWRVPIEVGNSSYQKEVSVPEYSPPQANASIHNARVIVSFSGGVDGAAPPGNTGGSGYIPNAAPAPPTEQAPGEPGFCGNGSTLSAFMILVYLCGTGRRKKHFHGKKSD